ncbi:MAG: toll/interleukin-1 receptor domain-containing protein [Promethearchaeati archaeon SRVP18_Atabeyarchaeia-1]
MPILFVPTLIHDWDNELLLYWGIVGGVLTVGSLFILYLPYFLPSYILPSSSAISVFFILGPIAIVWWVLPAIFVYLILPYVRNYRMKKESERKQNRRNEVEKLFRMFKRNHWKILLRESKVKAHLMTDEIVFDDGEPYLDVLMSYFRKNERVRVVGLEDLEEKARGFREAILDDRRAERERNAEADRLLGAKSMPSKNDLKRSDHVFICYSHRDSIFVDRLVEDLERANIKIWIDKWEIRVGDSLLDKINEGIEKNDYFITVLSKASVRSNWVRKELNAALMKELQMKSVVVLPVLLQKCKIPPLIADKEYADFRQGYNVGLKELLARFEK